MTDKLKYTPGPWNARKGAGWIVVREHAVARREAAIVVGMTPSISLVSDPTSPWFEEGESEANARLIAAAPDLLEALKALVDISKPMREEWLNDPSFLEARRCYENAQAAIAKAEGDSKE